MDEVPNTFAWMFYGYAALWGVLIVLIGTFLRRLQAIEKTLREFSSKQ